MIDLHKFILVECPLPLQAFALPLNILEFFLKKKGKLNPWPQSRPQPIRAVIENNSISLPFSKLGHTQICFLKLQSGKIIKEEPLGAKLSGKVDTGRPKSHQLYQFEVNMVNQSVKLKFMIPLTDNRNKFCPPIPIFHGRFTSPTLAMKRSRRSGQQHFQAKGTALKYRVPQSVVKWQDKINGEIKLASFMGKWTNLPHILFSPIQSSHVFIQLYKSVIEIALIHLLQPAKCHCYGPKSHKRQDRSPLSLKKIKARLRWQKRPQNKPNQYFCSRRKTINGNPSGKAPRRDGGSDRRVRNGSKAC